MTFRVAVLALACTALVARADDPKPREVPFPSELPLTVRPAAATARKSPAKPRTITKVVIHKAEGSAENAWRTAMDPNVRVAAHYAVGSDGGAIQMVDEKDVAFHAANPAVDEASLGVTLAGMSAKDDVTDKELRAAARLTRYLCDKYKIPVDRNHIIGHHEVPDPVEKGKFGGTTHERDPGIYFDWPRFMGLVRDAGVTPKSAGGPGGGSGGSGNGAGGASNGAGGSGTGGDLGQGGSGGGSGSSGGYGGYPGGLAGAPGATGTPATGASGSGGSSGNGTASPTTGSGSGASTGSSTGSDPSGGTGSTTPTSGSGSATDPGASGSTGSGTGSGSSTGTGTGGASDPGSGSGSGTGSDPGSGTGTTSGSGTGSDGSGSGSTSAGDGGSGTGNGNPGGMTGALDGVGGSGGSGSGSTAGTPASGSTPTTSAPSSSGATQGYTIEWGDTLSDIAAAHGMTWQQLLALTGPDGQTNQQLLAGSSPMQGAARKFDPNLIFPGQKLYVPPGGTTPVRQDW